MDKKIILLDSIKSSENNIHAIIYFEENADSTTAFLNIYGEEDEQQYTLKIRDKFGNIHIEEFVNCCKVFVLKSINIAEIVSCNIYIDKKLVMVQKDASGERTYNEADFYLDIVKDVNQEQAKIDREYDSLCKAQNIETKLNNEDQQKLGLLEELGESYDELFSVCDAEGILETVFKNSKWVRVPAFNKNYVAGILYSNNLPKYLCFGMPVFSKKDKPEELGKDSIFVPASKKHEEGFGYYIVFRNVENSCKSQQAI